MNMKKSTKIMIISFVSLVFVLVLVLGITKSFMKPIEEGGNVTDVSLNSCAKIKLTSTSNVNLSNSYPMSRNKGLKTTPYKFTVTSYCDSYVGFNLYVATLSSNTLDASNIRYILTNSGSKDAVAEGLLADASDGVVDFSDVEKTELNTGLKGTYGNIYKIHSESIPLKGNKSYDLYLFVDGDASNTNTMGKTFKAGVAVKSYDRNYPTIAESIISQYTGTQGENGLYYHDSSLTNGAGDNSYRYAGVDPNNYICFGVSEKECSNNDFYRIIGVFDGRVKLIKADYALKTLLGTDGDYATDYSSLGLSSNNYLGRLSLSDIGAYYWNYKNNTTINNGLGSNSWNTSLLNNTNLNVNFLDNFSQDWVNLIDETNWKIRGYNSFNATAKTLFTSEVTNSTKSYNAKVGLMYASDYGFAASPSSWTSTLYNYNSSTIKNSNWLYLGLSEWFITPNSSDLTSSYRLIDDGSLYFENSKYPFAIRPVFYLKADVELVSGSGNVTNPYILNNN